MQSINSKSLMMLNKIKIWCNWVSITISARNCVLPSLTVIFQNLLPLAFSHVIHHDVGIFEVFMSMAYHPKNSHCIYIDAKADTKVFEAVNALVTCYREQFLTVRLFECLINFLSIFLSRSCSNIDWKSLKNIFI